MAMRREVGAVLTAACVCAVWGSWWGDSGARGGAAAALVQRATPLADTGVLSRREMNAMSLRKLRDEHEMLEKRLSRVREKLENRRLERKVASLQQSIDVLRQRAALAAPLEPRGKAGRPGSTMLRKVEYKEPWSQGLGQTFTDDNNPLYDATPADKVMDPEERPFLR